MNAFATSLAAACLAFAAAFAAAFAESRMTAPLPLPMRLADTGLGAPGTIEFTPAYPLWSDGATKRRWLWIPPGTAIDKSNPDAWEFPAGTRAWKEFSQGGRVETRYVERLQDGSWRYAAYAWNEARTEARLVPEEGATLAVAAAPNGRYTVPSRNDCLACHEGASVPILGYSAVQLDATITGPTKEARDALGYLHGNCAHCHNANALPALDLSLAQESANPNASAARTIADLVDKPARYRPHGAKESPRRVMPGDASNSLLIARFTSLDPLTRMPALGVDVPDPHGLAVLARWIESIPPTKKEMP